MKKCYMIIVVVCALIMTACGTNSTSENTEKMVQMHKTKYQKNNLRVGRI